jgi:hypothetical protein
LKNEYKNLHKKGNFLFKNITKKIKKTLINKINEFEKNKDKKLANK